MDTDTAVRDYIAEHPGSNAVDLLCAGVVPEAQGTLWVLPVLDRLADAGTIEPLLATLWAEHVAAFPLAHTPGASTIARQGTRWRVHSQSCELDPKPRTGHPPIPTGEQP